MIFGTNVIQNTWSGRQETNEEGTRQGARPPSSWAPHSSPDSPPSPIYSHNYAQFYQLLDSNLFTHRNTNAILREAASENYDPRVYLYHILKSKNTLLQFIYFYFILCFCFSIYRDEI